MTYYFSYKDHETYFRNVQKIKQCLCLKTFSVFIYEKFNSNYFFILLSFFLVIDTSLVCIFYMSFWIILYLWAVLILKGHLVVAYSESEF